MNFIKTTALNAKILLTETLNSSTGIQIKNYNTNDIIRTVVNFFAALIVIVGGVYGLWQLAYGFWTDNPKDKVAGIVSLVASIATGGLMFIIVNLVLQ